jgi:pimeloyl-ACP methyl ester carboxylesterase
MPSPPASLEKLVARFDRDEFDSPGNARVRLDVKDRGSWDAVIDRRGARLVEASTRARPNARLRADERTWTRIAADLPNGMQAFRAGRLGVRENLHLGVSFLAATSGSDDPRRLRFMRVRTARGGISTMQAGEGPPVVVAHGLGATKASFLPTVAALAGSYRVIAIDLPGFGDSDKPVAASYDAAFFARSVLALLDSLEIERAHLVGNSMGGRVALEVGLEAPERVGRIALLAPALAWLRGREWAPYVRLLRPELGLVQLAPRPVVEGVVRRLIPGARDGWAAAGVDEFLRSFLTARGRAAFYAALRNVYLDEPERFWQRLGELAPDALFVWGKHDQLVPVAFARYVREALPSARHLELPCGHVPQLERPAETHAAIDRFFASASNGRAARGSRAASRQAP